MEGLWILAGGVAVAVALTVVARVLEARTKKPSVTGGDRMAAEVDGSNQSTSAFLAREIEHPRARTLRSLSVFMIVAAICSALALLFIMRNLIGVLSAVGAIVGGLVSYHVLAGLADVLDAVTVGQDVRSRES